MDRAIFLDRDGTVVQLVQNPINGSMEPPRIPEKVKFCDYAVEFMQQAQKMFKLYIISNQPDVAKRKQTVQQVFAVRDRFKQMIEENNIVITRYYYCYHHPEGTHPKYTKVCQCRKPAPGFIFDARERDDLDLEHSWIVGDRITDLECGHNAGMHGIRVNHGVTLEMAYKIITGGL